MQKDKEESEGLEPGAIVTPIEKQYTLPDFDMTLLLTDFSKIIVQFGYAVLFVTAFPLAPLMAFLSTYVQIRIDGWKLLQLYRRPEPRIAEDIGSWEDMLQIISVISIMTNIGMVTFTGKYFINLEWTIRWIIFLAAEHFVFCCAQLVDYCIPDIPTFVRIQLER
jgi:anoctamin-10/anoctamin-7